MKCTVMTFSSLALMSLLFACSSDDGVSESEREERRDLAFDVSGRYVEDTQNGTPATLRLANEAGVHDIKAVLEMKKGFAEVDRLAIVAAIMNDDPAMTQQSAQSVVGRIEIALLNLNLGEGETFPQRGGENIALDRVGDIGEVALRRSIGDAAVAGSNIYDATIDLYLTAKNSASSLSFEATPYTDDMGKSSTGGKGVYLSLTRRTSATGDARTVLNERKLVIGSFLKY